MSNSHANEIRAFIVDNFLFGDATQLGDDSVSLIENEVVDSTGVLELVTFLEERFGIAIADEEIVPANLDSVDSIATFVLRKDTAAETLQTA